MYLEVNWGRTDRSCGDTGVIGPGISTQRRRRFPCRISPASLTHWWLAPCHCLTSATASHHSCKRVICSTASHHHGVPATLFSSSSQPRDGRHMITFPMPKCRWLMLWMQVARMSHQKIVRDGLGAQEDFSCIARENILCDVYDIKVSLINF